METKAVIVLAGAIVLSVVLHGVFSRYEISATDRMAYKLDRWTGTVELCLPDGCK